MRLLLPLQIAWLAAALFAAHPVHVEAVGNSVGQGELWVVLFMVLAATLFLEGREAGPLSNSSRNRSTAAYALACLAKDNGLILPGLLIFAELTVINDPRPLVRRFKADAPFWVTFFMVGILYLVVRTKVTGTLAGDFPHIAIGEATARERLLTALRISLEWVRLLLWPAHLQADYSPQDIVRATSFGLQQVAGLTLLLGVGGDHPGHLEAAPCRGIWPVLDGARDFSGEQSGAQGGDSIGGADPVRPQCGRDAWSWAGQRKL